MTEKLKILYISYEPPLFPGGNGGQTRQYHLMRELAGRHEFHYLGPLVPEKELAQVREICSRVILPPPDTVATRGISWLMKRLPGSYPDFVRQMEGTRFRLRKLIADCMERERYDLVHVEHTNIAHWLHPYPHRFPRLLVAQNVKSAMWARSAERAEGDEKRRRQRDAARFRSYEATYLREYDEVGAMSEVDRHSIRELCGPGLPVTLVPNGVDTGFFTPGDGAAVPFSLVFTGTMNYGPNAGAMRHFCRDIWPRVVAAEPRATLSIVGNAPGPDILALAGDRITVTGFVPDTRPYLAAAAVVIVPLLEGGGTRLKIVEAMAMGKAIVSTSVGAEGLDCRHGEEVVIADGAAAFADRIAELLRDGGKRDALGEKARRMAVATYDWKAIAERLDEVYRRLAAKGDGA